jgi:GDSL-like Lipase/Acylhydrolase family
MRRPVRVLLAGVAVLLATLAPATTAAAQEPPPPLPDSIASIGDSISQAVDVCCFYGNWPRHSWSTGYASGDGVSSHYERILAQNPAIRGRRFNNSVSGAQMEDAPGQARRAVEQGADYVTILMGANDLCGWEGTLTPTATFRAQFEETIDILRAGLPGSRVFVSSIPDLYQLWRVLRSDPVAQAVWQVAGICPSMLRFLNSAADRQRVVDRQAEFQAVLREVCDGWSNCRFDGGLIYEFRFTRDMVSRLDYFHPNLAGQATLAAGTWRRSWWGT